MVHQIPFSIRHFDTSSTITTCDYLHDNVYCHSPTAYSAQRRVKLNAAWANRE